MEQALENVFDRPESLYDTPMMYCPGCGHGVVHRLVGEVIDEMELRGKTVAVFGVGCYCLAYRYMDMDWIYTLHGRSPSVATGVKRSLPDRLVFTYQGDGDLGSIGIAEGIHSAIRSENFSIVFVNNATYGMTGGQMAPTTLEGQVTTTSPYGRDVGHAGHPFRISEVFATIEGATYVTRQSVHTAPNVIKTKKAIKKAFTLQMEGKGFSLVEILSPCPSAWKLTPVESVAWLEENMLPIFPLGDLKDREAN
jgi:2-oxoglutarate ferredoxin oxidoreductase subunit beta